MMISGEIRPRAQYFDKMLKFRKTSLKFCSYFAKHSQKIAQILLILCFEIFAKHSQSAHILMKISVKFRNLLPICYQNANICKFSLNFRWLCDRRCEISIALGSKPRETVNISTKRGHIPSNFRRNKIIVKHLISRKKFSKYRLFKVIMVKQ